LGDHIELAEGAALPGWDRAWAEGVRLDTFEVIAPFPLSGTIQAASLVARSLADLGAARPDSSSPTAGWESPDPWRGGPKAYDGHVDQLALAPTQPTSSPQRSRADETMRRLLRVPDDRAPIDESETHRIFSASIVLSALRCLLSYIVLPVVLPAIGVARGVGPAIGIPVGLLALAFDYLGIRRFWLADHRQRWAFTALYAVVGAMVLALVIVDVFHAVH
jgi:hypothetical protein